MVESRVVECPDHGKQDEAFVCQHIIGSLHTGQPVGFFWSREDDSRHPDAWCAACEAARVDSGADDWTDELCEMLGVKILCGACYDHAKKLAFSGRKETQ